jgi:hypothetical protein
MAVRDAMYAATEQFVEPGERIYQVIAAQTVSPMIGPFFGLIGTVISIFVNRYRIIAVTDRRILVLDTGKWGMTKARAVVTELPRSTRLGPPVGLTTHTIQTPSGKLRVRRPFFKDIQAADSKIAPDLGEITPGVG